jgi:acid stress-induced BolA-like protein IbaG/YrbA
MPKYTQETARLKAQQLIKPYIRNGLNQSAVAKELGVTSEAINQRLQHQPVKDALREYINSPKLKAKLIEVATEALRAKKYTKKGSKPDHDARHKYWHDLVIAGGVLKENGKGLNATIIVTIGNKPGLLSPTEAGIISHERS